MTMQHMYTRQTMLMSITVSVLIVLGACSAVQAKTAEHARKLVILNWSEYMDPELLEQFEQEFDVAVQELYFGSEAERDEMLSLNNGAGYDLVMVSDDFIPSYIKRGWLVPFDEANIPNIQHIEPRWLSRDDTGAIYGVPYGWGITGIVYRADLVPSAPTSWKQLFQPDDIFRDKIILPDEADTVVGMALKALGYSMNTEDAGELGEAEQLLLAQKPFLRGLSQLELSEDSSLVSGDVWMALTYAGDALTLEDYHDEIEFVIPEEGGGIFIDTWGLLSASSNQELAMEFVNFLNRPEVAAQTAEYTYYSTPNAAAKALLPTEFLENPAVSPSEEILSRSEMYVPFSPRARKARNTILSELLQ